MAAEPRDPFIVLPDEQGCGAYPIPLGRITTAGFVGRTMRGPVNEPVCVDSFPEYCRHFGGHLPDQSVSFAVQDFFLHGGRRAVVVRVANRATRAQLQLPAGNDVLRLQARYPGRHEILRVSIDYERAEDNPYRFNLVVQRLDSAANRLVQDQELYPMVSVRGSDSRFIGDVLQGSRLIALAGEVPHERPNATPPRLPGEPVRYVDLSACGDDGEELTDYDLIGSDKDGTGLFSLARGPRIDLLAIPLPPEQELGTTAFVAAARYCESRRALMIWDPPWSWQSADQAVLGARRLDFANGHVMTYFPRIRPRGARLRYEGGLPASGAIAGMLAQRDRRGVWGAGEECDYTLRAALTPVLTLSVQDARRLARYGINAFVQATGGTTRLTGRVTLSASGFGPGPGLSLDSRRLGFFILNAIEDAATTAAEQGDLDKALPRVEAQIRRFFEELYEHGALRGHTPGQAYYVASRCDASEGRHGLRFGFALHAPSHFAEYAVDLAAGAVCRVQRVPSLEAEQFF
ncbi:MAG: hypothetical protein ACWGPN_07275, partial [Gammaproteobacteria bacterium]